MEVRLKALKEAKARVVAGRARAGKANSSSVVVHQAGAPAIYRALLLHDLELLLGGLATGALRLAWPGPPARGRLIETTGSDYQ